MTNTANAAHDLAVAAELQVAMDRDDLLAEVVLCAGGPVDDYMIDVLAAGPSDPA